MAGGYAFSVIGLSGVTAGMGGAPRTPGSTAR